MPEGTDLAALPTSWALTIWDAVPMFLSIELALAVLILILLSNEKRARAWQAARHHVPAGVVYLSVFDAALTIAAFIFGVTVIASSILSARTHVTTQVPTSPGQGLREQGGPLVWSIFVAAAIAAGIKVLIGPWLGSGHPIWIPFALLGAVAPISVGASAIPALAVATSAGSPFAGIVWLGAAALRAALPEVRRLVRQQRERREPTPSVSRSEDT